jgi:predicted  nucleic acid-binding Zn ribbon protein
LEIKMDINCPKCGEAWDMDELHDIAEENDTVF